MGAHPIETPRARPRPIAGASVQALEADAEELARRWAFALLAVHPLAEMTDVPLEEIARHAPALCVSVLRALGSEEELDVLSAGEGGRGGSAPGPAALSALARDWQPSAAVANLEALRHVLWEALLGARPSASSREVADLADRLACVCATLLAGALETPGLGSSEARARLAPRPEREQVLYRSAEGPGRTGAVLIDEFEGQARPALARPERRAGPSAARSPEYEAQGARSAPRALPWDIPLQGTPGAATAVRPPGGEDAVLRVSRGPLAPGEDPPG